MHRIFHGDGADALQAAPNLHMTRALRAGMLAALFANSVADAQNLHYIPVPYNAVDDFAMIGIIVEGPPLVVIIDAQPQARPR
jgi:hypothetical protein